MADSLPPRGQYVFVKKGSAPTTADSRTTGAVSTTLADTETYYISGISHTGTVTYTETNNTADTYQTSITGGTASAASALAPAGTKAMAATDVDDAGAVTFTNNLDEVSPTGIIERFGPFLAVAMVGAALAMLARRFKIESGAVGMAFGYMLAAVVVLIFDKILTHKDPNAESPIGMGDIKLISVGGLWCGPTGLAIALVLACAFGATWAYRKKQKFIPFAPFFVIGGFLSLITITFLI